MKVQFLVNTAYKGPRVEGEIIDVPKAFAERWAKNKIAKILEEENDDKKPEPEPETEVVSYEAMTAKELYELCVEKGIEVEVKQPKKYYIEKLA